MRILISNQAASAHLVAPDTSGLADWHLEPPDTPFSQSLLAELLTSYALFGHKLSTSATLADIAYAVSNLAGYTHDELPEFHVQSLPDDLVS